MNKKNIGIQIPEAAHDCLRLQSSISGITISSLLRSIIEDHIDEKGWSVDILVDEYASQIRSRWMLYWREQMNYMAYIRKTEADLSEKKTFPKNLIEMIVRKCRELSKQ